MILVVVYSSNTALSCFYASFFTFKRVVCTKIAYLSCPSNFMVISQAQAVILSGQSIVAYLVQYHQEFSQFVSVNNPQIFGPLLNIIFANIVKSQLSNWYIISSSFYIFLLVLQTDIMSTFFLATVNLLYGLHFIHMPGNPTFFSIFIFNFYFLPQSSYA